jgi:threonine/homoserine/homoserine lactone efflux protein
MESSLTIAALATLAGVMVAGALVPSVSVLAVTARAAGLGFAHGALTSLGIVVGDILFILIAIYGLAVLAELMGERFVLIKYLGGAYLVWLGVMLWRSRARLEHTNDALESSPLSSFMAGLLITLGDQKAVLFYLGFFPAIMDLSALSVLDTGLILAIAVVSVGGAKLLYALLAAKGRGLFKGPKFSRVMNAAAGSVIMGAGIWLIVTA